MVVPADPKADGAEPADSMTTRPCLMPPIAPPGRWRLGPHTGRTHQLRVHMKAIGHPILGDTKYGDDTSTALSRGLKLQLHARRLSLPHPGGGTLVIEAPLSPEMKAGFQRFGFEESEADPQPFRQVRRRR